MKLLILKISIRLLTSTNWQKDMKESPWEEKQPFLPLKRLTSLFDKKCLPWKGNDSGPERKNILTCNFPSAGIQYGLRKINVDLRGWSISTAYWMQFRIDSIRRIWKRQLLRKIRESVKSNDQEVEQAQILFWRLQTALSKQNARNLYFQEKTTRYLVMPSVLLFSSLLEEGLGNKARSRGSFADPVKEPFGKTTIQSTHCIGLRSSKHLWKMKIIDTIFKISNTIFCNKDTIISRRLWHSFWTMGGHNDIHVSLFTSVNFSCDLGVTIRVSVTDIVAWDGKRVK